MRLIFLLGAAVVTFLVASLVAQIAIRVTGVPKGFPPFTALPILSGVAGGFVLAGLTYAVLHLLTPRVDRVFFFVAILALALSFALPVRLSFTKSQRFAGVTPAAQMFMALMHTIVAAGAVTALTAGRTPTIRENVQPRAASRVSINPKLTGGNAGGLLRPQSPVRSFLLTRPAPH